jgi:Family of unknown function (DUF5990)
MELELSLRLIAVAPTAGCDFGLQKGRGSKYEVVSKQRSTGENLTFELRVEVKDNRKGGGPNFLGPFVQGPPEQRFFYIDIGEYAGQKGTPWSRRAKIPLLSIDWKLIEQVRKHPGAWLEARYAASGKDGGPSCASIRLLDGGWRVVVPK